MNGTAKADARLPCQLCEGKSFRLWDTKDGVDIIVCQRCDFGRAEMPPDELSNVHEVYGDDYHSQRGWAQSFDRQVRRYRHWLKYLTQMHRGPGTLLDIGCSLGYTPVAARGLGWQAWGTDISRKAVQETQERGFDAFVSTHPRDFPDSLPPLDAVVMAAVVEHLPDPFDYLRALRERMAPGGLAYIYVPDFSAILRRGPQVFYVGPPNHLWYFTRKTMARSLELSGWEMVRPPLVRPRAIGWRLHEWIPELLFQGPREALRPWLSDRGYLTNLHVFARVA
jgi:SAM-dependent methyltransferase